MHAGPRASVTDGWSVPPGWRCFGAAVSCGDGGQPAWDACSRSPIVPISGLCRPWHDMRCAAGDSYWRHRRNPVRVPGCTPAPRRDCGQDLRAATPILGAAIGVKALAPMRFRRASRALLRMSTCDASVRFRTPRLGPLGLCRPRRPV